MFVNSLVLLESSRFQPDVGKLAQCVASHVNVQMSMLEVQGKNVATAEYRSVHCRQLGRKGGESEN